MHSKMIIRDASHTPLGGTGFASDGRSASVDSR